MFKRYDNVRLDIDTICENCGQRYGEHYGDDCPVNDCLEKFDQEDKMTDLHDLLHKYPREPRMKLWWECYVGGTDGGKHYHHWTLSGAKEEAERLARLTGKTVYLFECVGKCRAGETPVKWETPTLW